MHQNHLAIIFMNNESIYRMFSLGIVGNSCDSVANGEHNLRVARHLGLGLRSLSQLLLFNAIAMNLTMTYQSVYFGVIVQSHTYCLTLRSSIFPMKGR